MYEKFGVLKFDFQPTGVRRNFSITIKRTSVKIFCSAFNILVILRTVRQEIQRL